MNEESAPSVLILTCISLWFINQLLSNSVVQMRICDDSVMKNGRIL